MFDRARHLGMCAGRDSMRSLEGGLRLGVNWFVNSQTLRRKCTVNESS